MGTCVNYSHCEHALQPHSSSSAPTSLQDVAAYSHADSKTSQTSSLPNGCSRHAGLPPHAEPILPPLRLGDSNPPEHGPHHRPAALEPPSDLRRQHNVGRQFAFPEVSSPVGRHWPSTSSSSAPLGRQHQLPESPTYPLNYAYQRYPSGSESPACRNTRPAGEHCGQEITSPSSYFSNQLESRCGSDDIYSPRHSNSAPVMHLGFPRYDFPTSVPAQAPALPTTWPPHSESAAMPSIRNIQPNIAQDSLPLRLVIRQQPQVARACGFGERDRRVIDPPPILQLELSKRELEDCESTEHCAPVHVIHASLWNESGTEDVTIFAEPTKKSARRLVGTLVASGAIVEDDSQNKGCFFIFADLSCRTNGKYRLRFNLVRLDPRHMRPGASAPVLASILSEVMEVYAPKEFPGMRRPTPLTQALKNQGVSVPAKKSKLTKSRRGHDSDVED